MTGRAGDAALRHASSNRLRFDLAELSGGMGDLGIFIPLAVSLIAVCEMDAGSLFVFAGLFNLLTGLAFRIPLPVQPMKAIAAVAVAEALSPPEIAAAGFASGAVVLFLALTGIVDLVERLIPRPVVRGIQLGVGIKLATKGLGMIAPLDWWGADSLLVALGGSALVLATTRAPRFPSALVLLTGGLALAALDRPEAFTSTTLGWSGPGWLWPSAVEWRVGILEGTLPQIPLTLLNSVVAVCALSHDLFPGRGANPRRVAISVGLMNLSACLLGGMPSCHGSGGLAAQYRFGARTGGSMVALGLAKIAVGVFLGSAAVAALAAFPASLLGVLLAFAGIELALPARDCRGSDHFLVAVATAAGILAFNVAIGFAVGLAVALLLPGGRAPDAGQAPGPG
jgi:MFS superfamily sulfate permease-like transporter